MTAIEISADYSDERAAWDKRMYEAAGTNWYYFTTRTDQFVREAMERCAKAYAEEVLAEREAKAVGAVPEGWQLVPESLTEQMMMRLGQYDVFDSVRPAIRQVLAAMWKDALRSALVPTSSPALPEQGWISVDDRMPPEGQLVMVYVPSDEHMKVRFDTWQEQYESPVEWSSATVPVGLMWDEHDFEEVTHWQPLPTPPAAKEQEKQNG